MKKEIFKVGDRVFHACHGWGEILSINEDYIRVKLIDDVWCFSDKNLLSFTEYTLQGFSQERPIQLPEVGELCLVSYDDEHWRCVKFQRYDKTKDNQFIDMNNDGWTFMKRIKIL